MEARFINELKNKQNNLKENILSKGLKDPDVLYKKAKINYNKISKKKDSIRKIKINEENKENFNTNIRYTSNYDKSLQINKNENFLVNKDMKYKNIVENKITYETTFYKLLKKIYNTHLGFSKNIEKNENQENFSPKKKKKALKKIRKSN